MSNTITGDYKKARGIWDKKEQILNNIVQTTGFKPIKLLYTGKILSDPSKTETLIWDGIYNNNPAVLKVVALRHNHPEPEIIKAFTEQNKSKIVRLPKLYTYQPFNEEKGYYYYIMEKVEGEKFYDLPIPNDPNKKEFLRVLTEYYTKTRNKPFFRPDSIETSTTVFILNRIFKWMSIAQDKEPLSTHEIALIEKFITINETILSKLPMEFQHRHARLQDFIKVTNDSNNNGPNYVLFSTAFWSYVPKYYSLTFHLWSAIEETYKLPQFPDVPIKQLIDYIDTWLNLYLTTDIPDIKKEKDFPKYFYALMLERATGSIIIDLRVRKERKGKDDFGNAYDYMYKAWHQIWEYCYSKLV